ncbi:MAG: hypothetical protein BGO78_07570 [Chloroflexi bacterium 44-23]|nr:MAG: hypothetical protein BGO78_07570 [Chloroflexi bacterium 44-23]
MNQDLQARPTFGKRLGRALIKIFRVVLVLAVFAAIIALIYYGTPYIYEKFIQPVEANSARIAEIESVQSTDLKQLKEQLATFQSRVAILETNQTEYSRKLSEVDGKLDAIDSLLNDHEVALASLDKLQESIKTLEKEFNTQTDNQEKSNLAFNELKSQLALTRVAELLGRSRLYLLQSNFGSAKQDVQSAIALLSEMLADGNSDNTEFISQVLERVEMVDKNLPQFPVIASADLEIAWQALVSGTFDIPFAPLKLDNQLPTPQGDTTITPMVEEPTSTPVASPTSAVTPTP